MARRSAGVPTEEQQCSSVFRFTERTTSVLSVRPLAAPGGEASRVRLDRAATHIEHCATLLPVALGRCGRSVSRGQIPVFHLPCMIQHVVGAPPDHKLKSPGPRRRATSVVLADRDAERIAVGAEVVGVLPCS
jgi:hypothetical protein